MQDCAAMEAYPCFSVKQALVDEEEEPFHHDWDWAVMSFDLSTMVSVGEMAQTLNCEETFLTKSHQRRRLRAARSIKSEVM
mmetsp:Transcript_6172/g.12492  ORF Transcript_6172/g.12492 Transcript_6172/m.12492 type:complete len:81 (+) Transcript_6172:426-668(+)